MISIVLQAFLFHSFLKHACCNQYSYGGLKTYNLSHLREEHRVNETVNDCCQLKKLV